MQSGNGTTKPSPVQESNRNLFAHFPYPNIKEKRLDYAEALRKKYREEQREKRRSSELSPIEMSECPSPTSISEIIYSEKAETLYLGVCSLRKFISGECERSVQNVVDCGVILKLIELLNSKIDPEIIYEAAWCITNLSTGSPTQIEYLVQKGVLIQLIKLLSNPYEKIQEQAVWAIGNIAGENKKYCVLLVNFKVLPCLASILYQTHDVNFLKNVYWTLSIILRGPPELPRKELEILLPPICEHIMNTDIKLIMDSCWTLYYLLNNIGEMNHSIFLSKGVISKIMELAQNDTLHLKLSCIKILQLISRSLSDTLSEMNIFALISNLLDSAIISLRKESALLLLNIIKQSPKQREKVFQYEFVPILSKLFMNKGTEIKKVILRKLWVRKIA